MSRLKRVNVYGNCKPTCDFLAHLVSAFIFENMRFSYNGMLPYKDFT